MAQTPAERQAARRERQQQALDDLTAANAKLVEQVAMLQAENTRLKDKVHALEIAALKAQIKASGKGA